MRCLLYVLALLLVGCSTPKLRHQLAETTPLIPPTPCVRIVNANSNFVQLQIAVQKFVPERGRGPAIWLTGVSHIGDPAYYAALQEHLAARTLVLFEGVRDRQAAATPQSPDGDSPAPSALDKPPLVRPGSRGSLQSSMAASLGLVFQLEAIDYDRANFRNCDLSIPELRRLIEQAGPLDRSAGATQSFEALLEMMQGDSLWNAVLQLVTHFLGASPMLQGLSKLALIETLGQINGDPSQLRGLPPSLQQLLEVLVAGRNQRVIADLKSDIKELHPGDSVAVFYGTGHMPDLARRLQQDLNYRPAEQLWFTAFSVDLTRTGISPSQAQFIHSFVKRELEQLDSGQMLNRNGSR